MASFKEWHLKFGLSKKQRKNSRNLPHASYIYFQTMRKIFQIMCASQKIRNWSKYNCCFKLAINSIQRFYLTTVNEYVHWGVGGQTKPKSCQCSLRMVPKFTVYLQIMFPLLTQHQGKRSIFNLLDHLFFFWLGYKIPEIVKEVTPQYHFL